MRPSLVAPRSVRVCTDGQRREESNEDESGRRDRHGYRPPSGRQGDVCEQQAERFSIDRTCSQAGSGETGRGQGYPERYAEEDVVGRLCRDAHLGSGSWSSESSRVFGWYIDDNVLTELHRP